MFVSGLVESVKKEVASQQVKKRLRLMLRIHQKHVMESRVYFMAGLCEFF